jgi:hypothetical protein
MPEQRPSSKQKIVWMPEPSSKQEIVAGDGSQNYQAGRDVVIQNPAVSSLLRDLRAFIRNRPRWWVLRKAGQLSFFENGMLATLRKIAKGTRVAKNQEKLRQQLTASEAGVNEIVTRIRSNRDRLAGQAGCIEFAHRIDQLIDGAAGKCSIRDQIHLIVDSDPADPHLPSLAQQVCDQIKMFNDGVIDLERQATN